MDIPLPPKNSAHLNLAASFAQRAWFPALPEVVHKFTAFAQQAPAQDQTVASSQLFDLLRSDLSLFTYLVGRISSATSPLAESNPVAHLQSALFQGTLGELSKELNGQIGTHSIDVMPSDWKGGNAWVLQNATLSASAAHALAPSFEINPEYAYLAGILRQLGTILIAWNYPKVFERAIIEGIERGGFEGQIYEILGFSPAQLGARIAEQWGFSSELQAIISHTGLALPTDHALHHLSKICLIGEKLARATNPAIYPDGATGWDQAADEIAGILGDQGMSEIYKRFQRNSATYATALPRRYPIIESSQPRWREHARTANTINGKLLRAPNRYVNRCTVLEQRLLTSFYHQLEDNILSLNTLDQLTKEIVPKLGFCRGCLYLSDPLRSTLVPRYSVGSLDLRGVREIRYDNSWIDENIICAAYRSKVPIVQEGSLNDGSPIVVITGSVGGLNRIGVLFLESVPIPQFLREHHDHTFDRPAQALLDRFKTIRDALQDALESVGQ